MLLRQNKISLGWGAYANNISSRRITESVGFLYNDKASSEDWAVYDYLFRKE